MSSIGDLVGGVAGFQPSANTAAQKPVFQLFEQDGVLRIQQDGAEQSHPLADAHCDACSSAFNILKKKSETGFDSNKLFAMAVEQTNRRQKILGVVAQPGQGPLEGLSATGGIRGTDPESAAIDRQRDDTVELSRSARRRAQVRPTEASQVVVSQPLVEPQQSAERSDANVGASQGEESGITLKEAAATSNNDNGSESDSGAEKGYSEADEGHGHSGTGGDNGSDKASTKQSPAKKKGQDQQELSEEEQARVDELAQRDAEVRAHEQAHKSAAGGHSGAISLSYETGPDGKRYAVAGEVPVDISPIKGDPAATIQKMQTIQRAALAPAEPSGADRRVAARARQYANQARMELQVEQREKQTHPGFNKATVKATGSRDQTESASTPLDKPQTNTPEVQGPEMPVVPNRQGDRRSVVPDSSDGGESSASGGGFNPSEPRRNDASADPNAVGGRQLPAETDQASGVEYSAEERAREQAVVDQATMRPDKGPQTTYGRRGFSQAGAVAPATFNLFG